MWHAPYSLPSRLQLTAPSPKAWNGWFQLFNNTSYFGTCEPRLHTLAFLGVAQLHCRVPLMRGSTYTAFRDKHIRYVWIASVATSIPDLSLHSAPTCLSLCVCVKIVKHACKLIAWDPFFEKDYYEHSRSHSPSFVPAARHDTRSEWHLAIVNGMKAVRDGYWVQVIVSVHYSPIERYLSK